ncbi:hypothetical protein [Bradyrhizobium sp.]|uniref:hypothetical protein n=1 Tax=Bradyrhizobium sp. TaxID=376 RepID=UPI0026335251|nr:hypothetical protein [Bradyrhizobium sp.]
MLTLLKKAGALIDTDRSAMRRASAALATAKKDEAELEAKLAKMRAIMADAEAADAAFHKAVADDDGGNALAEYAQGDAPDGAIAKIVERAQTTAALAVAARAAAPKVEAKLKELREQIKSLEFEKKTALVAYLGGRATETFAQYERPWNALRAAYDRCVGIRRALEYGRMIEPLTGPRFDDPEHWNGKHTSANSEIAKQTQARWEQARMRLDADADAFIDDLIGPTSGAED